MDTFRCPLKLILFGEHSVLEGGRCLSISINMYSYIKEIKSTHIVRIEDKNSQYFHVSIRHNKLKFVTDTEEECSLIVVETYLGCGLGTSASISLLLSFLKSLLVDRDPNRVILENETCLQSIDKSSVLSQALDYENVFHYISSGVDVCTSFYGGFISFKDKEVEQLDCRYLKQYKILIYDSKLTKNTANIIKSKINNRKGNISKLINLSDKVYDLMKDNFSLEDLYACIRQAQDILEDMDLVPDSMKKEVRRLREMGVESKISGAGRGGYLITIVNKETIIPGWSEVEIEENGFNKINF